MTANSTGESPCANPSGAATHPAGSVVAPAALPVLAIKQIEKLHVTCPAALSSATMAGGIRIEYQPGPFALTVTVRDAAGQLSVLHFDNAIVIGQFAKSLGLAGSSIAHYLARPAPKPLSAAVPKGPSRRGTPRANAHRVGLSGASGAAAGDSPSPTQPAPASNGAAPVQPAMPPGAATLGGAS